MTAIKEAAEALRDALKTVDGLRATTDPGANIDPPMGVVGPPALAWEAYSTEPTSARFVVYVVVAADEKALERLWELVPAVVASLEKVPDAALINPATPGRWQTGRVDLPSYELQIEVAI